MMTYNFDPDRWYENELAYLVARRHSGELSLAGYEAAVRELDRKYDEMVNRLDGSYQLPE
jgi:hypothetical protein